MSSVELGFAQRLDEDDVMPLGHETPHWEDWDVGKVGGKPSWLNPQDLPSVDQLLCVNCRASMIFVLQMYCPVPDHEVYPQAFHRTLYVFCCPSKDCWTSSPSSSVLRVLRCQLPRQNVFYPHDSSMEQFISPAAPVKQCQVCGREAKDVCSACHRVHYCSREHQVTDWKFHGHKQECGKLNASSSPMRQHGSLHRFPEYEIVTEIEPEIEPDARERVLVDQFHARMARKQEQEEEDPENPFTNDTPIDITQSECHEMLGLVKKNPEEGSVIEDDPVYVDFLSRVSVAKDQIIRYYGTTTRQEDLEEEEELDQDHQPLWNHSQDMHQEPRRCTRIPTCASCGAPRTLEVQIMPQLIYYLTASKSASTRWDGLDWGSLMIYTCTEHCGGTTTSKDGHHHHAYCEEYIWKQPSFDYYSPARETTSVDKTL